MARYLALRMLAAAGGLFVVLAGLTVLIDVYETLNIVDKTGRGGPPEAILMTLLRTPKLVQTLMPFVFLFGAMFAFFNLNRRSELAVMRSAGMSVWTMIAPAVAVALVWGAVTIFAFDPLAGRLIAQSERLRADLEGRQRNLLQVSSSGFWLRQTDENDRRIVIHAERVRASDQTLRGVTIWRSFSDGSAIDRIDAPAARLDGDELVLQDAMRQPIAAAAAEPFAGAIPTAFTFSQLNEVAAKPETMSIFELPGFIHLAETAGFPALRYKLHMHLLWATPLQFAVLVVIAAAFSMRPMRSGGAARLAGAGVGVGFLLYVVAEVAEAFGESGAAPIPVAAWTPLLIGAAIAINYLAYLEEA